MRKLTLFLTALGLIVSCKNSITIDDKAVAGGGGGGGGGTGPCSLNSTVTVSPKSNTLVVGSTMQGTATWNCDGKVEWYSTDGSRVDVIHFDTTYVNSQFPWGVGTFKAGFIKALAPGQADVCAKLVLFPSVHDCMHITVTGTSTTVTVSSVNVTPQGATISLSLSSGTCSATQLFSGQVLGSDGLPYSNQGLTWTTSGGGISSSGLFTASAPGTYTVTGASVADPNVKGTAQITVSGSCQQTGPTINPVGPITLGSGTGCTNNTGSASITNGVAVTWTNSNPSVVTVTSSTSTTVNFVSVSGTSGSTTITGTAANGLSVSLLVNVSNASCNTGVIAFGTPRPADTTIMANTRYHLYVPYTVPAGVRNDVLVRTSNCLAYVGAPVITSTGTNTYQIDLTVQGIATCQGGVIILKSAADTTISVTAHANVVSAPGPTIVCSPASASGVVGTGGRVICTISGSTDTRVWYYSTDPSRVSVVQKDTTFAAATNPWTAGSHFGGEYRYIWTGSADECGYSPSNPSIIACITHTVTAASGNLIASSTFEIRDHPVTVELNRLYTAVRSRSLK
ncbi:hypothetical protein KW790_00335 [Candidatus Parcubacteria bacterium]|nr:hypothetical protein [Candidatus Parcubacteria bacterium]